MEQPAARRELLRDLAASPLISAPSIAPSIAAFHQHASFWALALPLMILGSLATLPAHD